MCLWFYHQTGLRPQSYPPNTCISILKTNQNTDMCANSSALYGLGLFTKGVFHSEAVYCLGISHWVRWTGAHPIRPAVSHAYWWHCESFRWERWRCSSWFFGCWKKHWKLMIITRDTSSAEETCASFYGRQPSIARLIHGPIPLGLCDHKKSSSFKQSFEQLSVQLPPYVIYSL